MRIWPVTNKMIEEEERGPHIVMFGDPWHGFHFYGPFANRRDALRWSERVFDGAPDHWHLIPLEPPNVERPDRAAAE